MKQILILLALMLTLTTVKAQDNFVTKLGEVAHMKFMGIPMDCDAESFSKRLVKEKGLIKGDFADTDSPTLRGTFSGYKDCIILVGSGRGGNVEHIGVVMPMKESFSLLKSQYQTLKSKLITKYGKPDNEVEGFGNYEPSSDFMRMNELREGNAKFECTFIFEEGLIKLMMASVDISGGFIQLIYIDFKNSMKSNESDLDDL